MRRVIVTTMMGLAIACPLLIALNPTWIEPIPPPAGQPLLTVLVDGTMSMATADCDPATSATRWQAALDAVALVEPSGTVEVRRHVYDHQLQALPSEFVAQESAAKWPRGHRTDLARVIRESVRSGSAAGHAVLLLSDGAHNVGSTDGPLLAAREAKSLDVPIYTVTLGTVIGAKNLSLAARSPRMISFPDNPLVLRVRVGQSGLAGQSTTVALLNGDRVVQSRPVRLVDDPNQEISFVLADPPTTPLQRFRIVASPIKGEATDADNQTTILVQRLDQPIGVLLLEGKPYWDSKFLARNLSSDPVVELTSIVRLSEGRFLARKHPRPKSLAGEPDDHPLVTNPTDPQPAMEWEVQRELESPLDSMETLSKYRLVILGRDADAFLTDKSLENLRQWISRDGGCLMCARGAPTNEIVGKLSELLPVRWTAAAEARFRSQVSQYGFDAAVFDPLMLDGDDPLASLPSLSVGSIPKPRVGLPQVLVQSVLDDSGVALPVVTYQPYGSGQTIVIEGAGMWRWAFLPPQHAVKDKVYPALWQSLIQWLVSQQELPSGQKVGIRSDRATFLTGDQVSATVLVRTPEEFRDKSGELALEVLLEGPDMPVPKRFTPTPSGTDGELFRVDFGTLGVGYYTASVVRGERDEKLAETALEIRDPWFESLELEARPDVMRRIAEISGGKVLEPKQVATIVQEFQQRLEANRPQQVKRTTLWDRPMVLLAVLSAWLGSWIVRRRSGLV